MVLFEDLLFLKVQHIRGFNHKHGKLQISHFWSKRQKGQAPQSVMCACCLDNWKIETLGLSYGCCLIIQGQGLPTGTHYHTDYGLW